MKKYQKLLAGVCALAICTSSLAGCNSSTETEAETTTTTEAAADATETTTTEAETTTTEAETEAAEETTTEEAVEETTDEDKPLVVAYDQFSEKFSPFFADTSYDMDVSTIVVPGIMTTDRTAGIIYNAIEGETVSYNGTDYTYTGPADISFEEKDNGEVVYTIKLREDLAMPDGTCITADDLIFTYYVLADPSYAGSTTLYSYPIKGITAYRTQVNDSVSAKYEPIVEAIEAAGEDHVWSADDTWTEEQQTAYWELKKQLWLEGIQAIVDYVVAAYGIDDYTTMLVGATADEVTAEEGLQVALGMAGWGFGSYDADTGIFTTTATGTEYDLANGTYPTLEDYYNETYAAYDGDASAFSGVELAGVTDNDVTADTQAQCMLSFAEGDTEVDTGAVTRIEGIKKTGDYEVQVTCDYFVANAIYTICGVQIAPLSYYGDPDQYDYDNDKFGFPMGDLSIVQAKTTQPYGWGPYQFVKYENKIVYFEANPNYYKGEPEIKYLQFKETAEADKISAVGTGAADISNPSGSKEKYDEIKSYNSNGESTGDVLTAEAVDYLGYGYIGMNADTVNVAGDPDSEESKNLRKGIATILAAYRDLTVDSYYGEAATVINYPISNTSWAAPQKTDSDYEVAYSKDVDGNEIYTSDMDADAKYAAAIEAAKTFFIAAGYTYDEASGTFTAAPEGAKLEYEVIIPANGGEDHPSFALLTAAQEAFASIGFTLTINNPSDNNVLWDKLDAGTQELWCAAWGATIDPDMYQVYYSTNIAGMGGSDSNHYHIQDAELDENIMEARNSADQTYRKTLYKECFDIILDWAVEIPIYQRADVALFSTERINMDTVTTDITTYWGYASEIETLEMAQ